MSETPTRTPVLEGLLVTAGIALAATAVPRLLAAAPGKLAGLPVSPILVAILLGLALSGVARRRAAWTPGLVFAAGPVLKLAVMLIGLRLSLGQVGSLGVYALPLVCGAIVSGLGLAWLLGRAFGVGANLTALLAVGSAICGASAIAATAPALKSRPEETAYALACVALFGLAATIAYPWLLDAWFQDGRQVGLVLGAAIHDTSQVTAAALLFEQTFGATQVLAAATVTKLLRNLCMLAVIPAVVWWAMQGQGGGRARPAFPLFILGFLALAATRSSGDLLFAENSAWQALLDAAATVSAFLFAMAMASIGMGIRVAALRALGVRPALVALLTALGMGAVALVGVSLLPGLAS
jgi:uncharacterized integral membrane protein (TIGR00698 family)